jgi:hypothetical protein
MICIYVYMYIPTKTKTRIIISMPKKSSSVDNSYSSKIKTFIKLSEFDSNTSMSRIVDIVEFDKPPYLALKFGNGGSWCRMDSSFAKQYKYVTRKKNGKITYSWTPTDDERVLVEQDFQQNKKIVNGKGNKITHIKIYGVQNKEIFTRRIREDIRKYYANSVCVVCGRSDVEIDHKNGLYNDPRVLTLETQTIDDFQPLCQHCNLQKRQSMVYSKETGKRYPATKIPQLKIFEIDFVDGGEAYDINDPNAMNGTYWYDPVSFMKEIKKRMV